ncbi:exported protein [Terrihabitans soli]|uniref:Exported protein n=1 Tax=Terrihabitans soli TaxID=708113 RepID=A0A6S6QTX1_9HYPH|nr:tripartite tricarboxylate transporter substrate binding protein [Terrihabitans soli]BCJ89918.1 exported protein [Terrihabitans soli]
MIKNSVAALAAVLAMSAGFAGSASAETYPSRPIRLIVPYAPGGPADIMARLIGDKMSARLGQQVVVENKTGGGGVPALELLKAAPADGYTIAMGHDGNMAAAVSMFAKLPYDPVKDFAPISLLASSAVVLITNPTLGFKTVDDLIAAAKKAPGTLNYASAGIGSGGHFAASRFAAITGIDIVHIPYDGGSPAALAVVSNQSQLVFQSPVSAKPYIDSGQATGLAVASAERNPQLPNVPTLKESGVNFTQLSWYGLVARADVKPEIIEKLHKEVSEILAMPDVKADLEKRGLMAKSSTPAEFTAYLKSEIPLWADAVKLAGIKMQ